MDQFDDRWQRRQERWARKRERRGQQHSAMHGVLVGGLIITVGVMFLLDNLGIIRFHDFWRYWPVILIVFGLVRISEAHGPSAIIWGSAVAGFGGLLLADNLNLITFDWRVVWPVLVIVWGLIILLRPRFGSKLSINMSAPPGATYPDTPSGADAPTLRLWAVFGGGRRRIVSQDFRGGEISAVFGGYEIDLRGAAIAQESAVLDINAMFGGVEVKVPETWTVENRGMGIFGGFEDETQPPRSDQITKPQHLIVTGYATFGGIAIKN